jgi:phosphoribosylaminoimidazolecarboxamide formyltransferase/IMP cyclohydrolase
LTFPFPTRPASFRSPRFWPAGIEIISTGGTAKTLREAGLTVKDISEHTGFPEMLDGRVKTLHPKVHGGLLYIRGNATHEAAVKQHGITPIDLVVVNLYPFEQPSPSRT